jgi:hypothetical protein
VQILDTLIRKNYDALTASEIAKYTDISESTFTRNKGELLELEMIEEVNTGSGPSKYTINEENGVVQTLVQFHLDLSEHAEEIFGKTTPGERDLIATLAHQSTDSSSDSEHDDDSEDEYSRDIIDKPVHA